MDWYIVFLAICGIPVQAWIGWMIGKGLVKAVWSLACAISVCRWGFAVGSVHGFRCSAWIWVPPLIAREWLAFFRSPYDSISQSHHGGNWHGIGNWCVFPKRDSRP